MNKYQLKDGEYFYSLIIAGGAVFGQDFRYENSEISLSKKVFYFTFSICGYGLYCGYSAHVTSALSVPSEDLPFRSPEEILNTPYR